MRTLRDTRGQTVVLTVVFLTGLLAMTAFVLDVGSWYRAHRAAQATADAAALAAAQALPENPAEARSDAVDYAGRNGGGVTAANVTFSRQFVENDTVTVRVEREAPGLFARMFGIASVSVGAKASARSTAPAAARYVAPIVVNIKHPFLPGGLGCNPRVCDPIFNQETTLRLENLHSPGSGDAAGAFGLIDLKGGSGSVGAHELSSWMAEGFSNAMPLGKYNSVPSVKFNSVQFRDALDLRLGTEVLFPIYDSIRKSGSTAEYNIVGWIGFVPTSFAGGGDDGNVKGYFTRVVWQGIPADSGSSAPSFGVHVISLVK